ncbi:50S ribosomal protein L16 [Candidatus Dependentiae bacterium]|nr:50S ribosomal protein L16 [Candidatus Dependentiae bacterium]MBU4387586.1 50S ribosomal protein L16 [Candidatus Dependentiae bacterium]MCG2756292.1 50S ribosomal protein L16 [Candidatus Dependentiae bacterium]
MLMPKKTKYRKIQRGRLKGKSKASDLAFGDFGLAAVDPGWLTARQIESARVAVNRHLKKGGTLFLRVFPDKPITKKPAETRMGKGKGNPEFWVAVVKRGKMLMEVKDVSSTDAKAIFKAAAYKIPMKTKLVCKQNVTGTVNNTKV